MPLSTHAYLYASAAVGIAQVVDAFLLTRKEGRTGLGSTAFSLSEYVWAAFSFYIWNSAEAPFPYWLPISFIAYVASFFAAGLFLAAQHRGNVESLAIPNHLVVAGGVFGVYFAMVSLFQAITI
jgi:hypothetical protein